MIRFLKKSDYLDYLDLISQLTIVGVVSIEQFNSFVDLQNKNFSTLVFEMDFKIVGCVTYLIEQKIQRSFSCVMHIEDVVTDAKQRGKGISKQLLNQVISIAEENNCYKVLLDCSQENVSFYEKIGFNKKEHQMVFRLKSS